MEVEAEVIAVGVVSDGSEVEEEERVEVRVGAEPDQDRWIRR